MIHHCCNQLKYVKQIVFYKIDAFILKRHSFSFKINLLKNSDAI